MLALVVADAPAEVMGTTVLVGFAEALSAPEVVWSLADQGITVVAFSRRGRRTSLRRSRFVQVLEVTPPETDLTQATSDLKDIILRLSGSSTDKLVLMPLDDEALWLCGRTDFGNHIILAGPQGEAVEIALNKQKQIQLAQAAGFNVPWTRLIEKPEDALSGQIDFPVVFKSALAVITKGLGISKGRAWICSGQQELQAAVASWAGQGPMLLQKIYSRRGRRAFWIGNCARRARLERTSTVAHDESAWFGCQRMCRGAGLGWRESGGRRIFPEEM